MAHKKNRTALAILVHLVKQSLTGPLKLKFQLEVLLKAKSAAPTEWRKQKTGQRLRNGAFTRFLKVIKEK
jgi:hypothetical protein